MDEDIVLEVQKIMGIMPSRLAARQSFSVAAWTP